MRAIDEPYPGLRSFRRDETHIFFGRETVINVMVDRLAAHRFLAVTGASGSGKSSLVRTGLLDALDRGLLAAAGSDWRVADFRPGRAPLAALAAALIETVGSSTTEHESLRVEAMLARGPLGLVEWLNGTELSRRTNLLLLVDQFEEIIRFRRGAAGDDIDAFVALLLASAQQRQRPIYVVLTMRSDFLGECAQFNGLAEAINDGQFLTPRMSREQCQTAIEGPAAVFGGCVEPALVTRLLNDMGTSADQLPLVQHALMRLWRVAAARSDGKPRVLRIEDYAKLGGIGSPGAQSRGLAYGAVEATDGTPLNSALSAHADEILRDLSPEQQRLAMILFQALTESEGAGGRDVRHPVALGEAAAVAGVPVSEMVPIVEAFRAPGRNLLMPPSNVPLRAETVIDITHESLIRQWVTLRDWVREEYDAADTYRLVEKNAKLWANGHAALLTMPFLGRAFDWRKQRSPNAEWAERYGGDFAGVTSYLDSSQRAEQQRLDSIQRAERQRRNKKILIPAVSAIVGVIIVFASGFAFYAVNENHWLQDALVKEEDALRLADANRAVAEDAKAYAEREKVYAEQAKKDAQAALAAMVAAQEETARIKEEARERAREMAAAVAKDLGPRPTGTYADETKSAGVDPPNEPVKELNGPTPSVIPGGKVLTTAQMWEAFARTTLGPIVLVDVWIDVHPTTIPSANRLPTAGQGTMDGQARTELWRALKKLSGGNFNDAIVFFGRDAKDWEGYNAALRAIDIGFDKVYWYRGGIEAWTAAHQPLK